MLISTLRLGARKIVRYPAVSAVTFLTLAVGIAVFATVFAVTWATLIRPLPYRDADRLVAIWASEKEVAKLELNYEEVERIRGEARSIETIVPYAAANFPGVLKRKREPMQLSVNIVGAAYFKTLGIAPFRGRAFNAAETRVGGPDAAMLSYNAWKNRFGGDPHIVGEALEGWGRRLPVVGILPQHAELPAGAEIVFPLDPTMGDPGSRLDRVLVAIARLRPGATREQLDAELSVVATHHLRAHPERKDRVELTAYPFADEILGSTRHALRIVFAIGLLVLLIALFNTASVALAQGINRTGEIGVRRAAGATRFSTLVRFFIEASVLTLAAGAAGFVLGRLMLAALLRITPASTPRIDEVHMGWETALFALGAALLAAAIAAIAQTFRATDAAVMTALRASTKSTSHRGTRRVLEGLAAAQTAVAVVTLVVAALLTQSFRAYSAIDVGFSSDRVLTFHLPRGYLMPEPPDASRAFFHLLLDRLRQIDGVEAAGSTLMRPLEQEQGWDFTFTIEGQDGPAQERNPLANMVSITPGYFNAMGTRVVAGRDIRDGDRPDSPPVTVIGESFARRYFGSPAAAIGKRLKSGPLTSPRPWMTVAGVVRDVRSRGLTTEKLDLYLPYTQTIWSPNYVALRTSRDPESLLPAVRALVAELDKGLPVSNVRTTGQLVDAKLAQARLSATVVVLFAITATLLAVIGFYGMLAYIVRERTPEIGIRMALGADAPDVLRMIVQRAAIVAGIGIAAGLLVSMVTNRLWQSYLYGVSGIDARLFLLVAVAFELVAVIASLFPAARAARIDAVAALGAE